MNAGVWALVAAVAVAVVFGLVHRSRQGRITVTGTAESEESVIGQSREPYQQFPEALRERLLDEPGGEDARVTLLQFSTTFCAPCRHTRILLGDFAQRTQGVRHVEIDLTDHPEWSTPLRVHTTPTTFALDGRGRELFRISGVPRRQELTEALQDHLA
jgi:thiol-disulfide isomerase/thioredoxin